MKTIKMNNRGFTLVEVICAVTILMLVVLPIFTGFLMAAKTNAEISDKLDVNLVLQNELEQIKATGIIENVRSGEHLVKASLGNYKIGDSLVPSGNYIKTVQEIKININIEPVKVNIDTNDSIAYYIITITYDNETEDDTSDDVILKGVYSPW